MEEERNEMISQNVGSHHILDSTISEIPNVIRPYGYSVTKCGYCKGARSNLFREHESTKPEPKLSSASHSTKPSSSTSPLASKSYSVLADSVSPKLYEGLINLGWRRSGLHLYKPQNFSSCCPTLTTRLLTREFKPSKSQRRVLKKMEKILGSSQGPTGEHQDQSVIVGNMATTNTPISTPTFTSKKQKRNHRKQLNSNERKSSSKQQSFPPPDTAMDGIASSLPLSVEDQVIASGILEKLEQATTTAIEKCFASFFTQSNYKNKLTRQNIKDFDWKTSYRILSPSKRERKQSQVRVVSSICAQICGRLGSTLSPDSISTEKLVHHVVHTIKNTEESLIAPNKNIRNDVILPPHDPIVSVTCIDAHQPSGQISCTIEVKSESTEIYEKSLSMRRDEIDTKIDKCSSREHGKNYQKSKCRINHDKLLQWYENTIGKRLELGPTDRCVTIATLPSHESALNPDVHKLYAHYQHVVHGDQNPFSPDSSTEYRNADSDKSDDEDEERKKETDNPSELEWGDAPSYFTSEVTSMLTSYIQPIESKECRRAVLSNYHSFYQFLVEAPFPLHDVSNSKGIRNSNKSGRYTDSVNNSPSGFLPCGLYHQHYRIGECLIAVGVIDILPTGLSSVYLFYHPGFSHDLVALGKYAILKEIEFARDVLKVPYYYLGYYIESCQKMRYKADYKPTQILCPKYNYWVDAIVAIPKLQTTLRHVCPLADPVPTDAEETESDRIVARNSNNTAIVNSRSSLSTNDDIAKALNVLQMDVGAGMNVTIDMIQPNGVEVLKPILENFVQEFSPALSKQCILKLTN